MSIGYRQLNQTDKKPTGEFNRDSLLEYLEEQARSQPEIEDYVPHIPGQKKGKIYKYVQYHTDDISFYILDRNKNRKNHNLPF